MFCFRVSEYAEYMKEKAVSYKIFSYGTLQMKPVQLSTFGRELSGTSDKLRRYRLSTLQISNFAVIARSGIVEHPVAIYTDDEKDYIDGTVFDVSESELALADQYEDSDYKRIKVQLDSGTKAWVYVKKGIEQG